MSQQARIGGIVEGFITAFTGLTPTNHGRSFRSAKDLAMKGVRPNQYARTNQFDVDSRLDGLDEKFRVLNREDLADALVSRLRELKLVHNRWTPELLSLFLQLSDRPVEKSRVEDLELLRPPPSPPPLTWAEIIADDPLTGDIWEDIDYGVESSGDEQPRRQEQHSLTPKKIAVSLIEDGVTVSPESFTLVTKETVLDDIKAAQFWVPLDHSPTFSIKITELQAIREVLFMLGGSKSSLFQVDSRGNNIKCLNNVDIGHTTSSSLHHLLQQFAQIGTSLFCLRQWALKDQSIALFQTLQAACECRLVEFYKRLADFHNKFLAPASAEIVSLLVVHDQIRSLASPLISLSNIVTKLDLSSSSSSSFSYLDVLFKETELAQMIGNEEVFESLAHLFFECLQTYLKPIQSWMENGELGIDENVFFITKTGAGGDGTSLWHDRYTLRRSSTGKLLAPYFLEKSVARIFNSGKSIVFLKELDAFNHAVTKQETNSKLNYEIVCGESSQVSLAPFSVLFEVTIDSWIKNRYTSASTFLLKYLQTKCGLWKSLEAIEFVFFCRNGAQFETFANSLFEGLDGHRRTWNDRFILTELAQNLYGTLKSVDPENLIVRSIQPTHPKRSVQALSCIKIDYMIPWPLLNIIKKDSFKTYQEIFILLLQCYRAKYLLQQHVLNPTKSVHTEPNSYLIRQRLIWFVDILRAYLTQTVIVPSTIAMLRLLNAAEDIDAMSSVHDAYISSLQSQCLISKKLSPIYETVITILDLPSSFSAIQDQKIKNGSNRPSTSTQVKRRRRKRNHKNRHYNTIPGSISSSDSDDEDDGDLANNEDGILSELPDQSDSPPKLGRLQEQFDKQISFVVSALRTISRAGGEPNLEVLAERLDWKPRKEVLS